MAAGARDRSGENDGGGRSFGDSDGSGGRGGGGGGVGGTVYSERAPNSLTVTASTDRVQSTDAGSSVPN